MSDYEIMEQSIFKNVQELSELCVDLGITNAYDLMGIVSCYCAILERAKNSKNGKVLVELGDEE